MDVYRFVDSRDIRAHLLKIGYQFTMQEAAFLVWYCETATLEEKILAWEEIARSMPNCSLEGRSNMEPIPDFHAFLREYIGLQRHLLARFKDTESRPSVYQFAIDSNAAGFAFCDCGSYSSFERCLSVALKEAEDAPCSKIRIAKRNLDPDESSSRDESCTVSTQGEVLSVDCTELSDHETDINMAFEGMWIDLPTPFHSGDIVCSIERPDEPFVLTKIATWNEDTIRAELLPSEYSERFLLNVNRRLERYRKNGDISDMGCYGYGISLYGAEQDAFLWSDDFSFASYLDVEHFRNPLDGAHKVLKPVSLYLKRKCNLEFLINSFLTLRQKSAVEGALEKMRGAYLPECLKEVDMGMS